MWAWLSALISKEHVVIEEHALSRHVIRLEREIDRLSEERDYYRALAGIPTVFNSPRSETPELHARVGQDEHKAGAVTFQRVGSGRVRRKDMLETLQTQLDARVTKQDESEDAGA